MFYMSHMLLIIILQNKNKFNQAGQQNIFFRFVCDFFHVLDYKGDRIPLTKIVRSGTKG